jgi:hypothetical protein
VKKETPFFAMKFIGIWVVSSIAMLTLIGAVCAGKMDGFNRWMFHSTLGGLLFLFGLAVLAVGTLCTIVGWFRRK